MKDETREELALAIQAWVGMQKDFPEMYSDDRIHLLALTFVCMEEPSAPCGEVERAIKYELVCAYQRELLQRATHEA